MASTGKLLQHRRRFPRRIERHEAYFRYIREEFIPAVATADRKANNGTETLLLLTRCSMGGFQAANFLFRYPWMADGLIALSGVCPTRHFFGDNVDGAIYFNSPMAYLPGLEDEATLHEIRRLRLMFCCGQGAWEDEMLDETRALDIVLRHKGTKPAPDIFPTALAKLSGVEASDALVVGDTPYDIQAAKACGIGAIALRSGGFPDDALHDAGALCIYDDVAAILRDYGQSPLAK